MTTPTPTPAPASRGVQATLAVLLATDVFLAAWAFACPDLWFKAFHGVPRVDPQALLFRMGAAWTAFALVQAVGLARWRASPRWLAIVAGVRLSDALTDWTYLALCQDVTWFGRAALFAASPTNLLAGWYLLREHAKLEARVPPPS